MIGRLRRILTHPAIKAAYLLILVAAAGFYLVRWGDRLPELVDQVRPLWVGLAFGLTCLSGLLYSYIQHVIYRQLGARTSYGTVFRIVTVSQLGKYLPGKVLFFGNFYLFSREVGIQNVQIGASFLVSMALWILTASLCGLPVLSLLEPSFRYLIVVLPVLLALCIHPRVLGWLFHWVQKTLGRFRTGGQVSAGVDMDLTALGFGFYLWAAFLYLATWGLGGLAALVSLAAVAPVDLGVFPLALASISLGTIAGFAVLFAPVGLGVREGIGTLILSPVVGVDVALLGMLLLRGVTVVADLILALAAVSVVRRPSGRAGLPEAQPAPERKRRLGDG